jgi:hypothetical protein
MTVNKINNDKFSNNFAHEMGHFLGAKHTILIVIV